MGNALVVGIVTKIGNILKKDFLIDLQTKGYDYVKDDIISKDK